MRNSLLSARSASICALVAAVTACAGGGPGSAKPDDDPAEPQVNVQFPPPFSQTDEPTFLSYGTCQDADQIAALHIGGAQAFTADGFQTWQAKSLLSPGLNLLDVDVTLKDGTLLEDIDVLSVRLDALRMGDPIDVTTSQLRMLGPAAYYLDANRIIEQDLTTGKLVEITGPINGSGPTFENPLAIACTLDASVLFVLDRASSGDRIVSVQGQTGSRAELSGPNVGAGTPLRACTDLTFFSRGPNPWENGLLVATGNLGNGSGGTLRVDLLGNRGNEESYGGALPQAQYLHATSLGQGPDTTFCFAIQDNSLFAFPTDNPGSFTEMASLVRSEWFGLHALRGRRFRPCG